MLQRLVAISLLIAILYQQVAHYVQYKIEQHQIKEEVKRKIIGTLPENELTILSFYIDEYKKIDWCDDGKEINYKGKLYDVVRKTEEKNGIIKIYCINDSKEEQLITKLNAQINEQLNNSGNSSSNSKKLLKNFIKDYFISSTITLNNRINFHKTFWPIYFNYIFDYTTQIFSPPQTKHYC